MTVRLPLSLLLAASLALAGALAAAAQPVSQPARVTHSTVTYSCGASPAGKCAFLLYASDCKEAAARNGYPSLVCTHAVVAEFSLKPGESKTFHNLPSGVRQCQPRNGRLAFPDCMG